jgi:hypothetical protein
VHSCEHKQTGENVIEFDMVCRVEMRLMFYDWHINEQIKRVQTSKSEATTGQSQSRPMESPAVFKTHDFSHGLYFLVLFRV